MTKNTNLDTENQALHDENVQLKQEMIAMKAEMEALKSKIREDKLLKELQEQKMDILQKANVTDPLSGLLNRTGFEQKVKNTLAGTGRRQNEEKPDNPERAGIFLMFDLDKFKPINDTYGHQAGDTCLQFTGATIQSMIRDSDAAARLGGDEFVVFLAGDNTPELLEKSQEIQNKINNLIVDWKDNAKIKIGASMGVSIHQGNDGFEKLYEEADIALYSDKEERHKAIGEKPRNKAPSAKI